MRAAPARRRAARARAAVGALVVVAMVAGCAAPRPPRATAADAREGGARRGPGPILRIALVTGAGSGTVDADGPWRILGPEGRSVLAHARGDQPYRLASSGRAVVATPTAGGFPATSGAGVLVIRPDGPDGLIRWNGRRYRGELVVTSAADGLLVVNRVSMEDYLRGVVPREVGSLAPADRAAVEAQAVAARSYALAHITPDVGGRGYDMGAGVSHQVYGGADAERPASDAAVAATGGQVLLYAGRVVDAPYHSTCGGSTAEPREVWQEDVVQPYLRRVSDQIPGTSRAYCDISPTFSWRRTFDGAALDAAVGRYLRSYVTVPARGPGAVRAVRVASRTPSGRVAELGVETDAGRYTLRGNQIRSVLRGPGGDILNSTYFTVETMLVGGDGHVAQLTVRGSGNGHGVGMCQWGSVGRARAGHDYRAILRAYYPGAEVGYAGRGYAE